MAAKELKTRIKSKRDPSSTWTASNPILLDGEIIIVDTANGETRKKIGDGVHTYTQLPFDDEAIYNALNLKCDASTSVDVTLLASAWSNEQQTVAVSGATANKNGFASLPQNYSVAQYEAVIGAELFICGQGTDTVTFAVNGDVPQVDIPVVVILLG